ncbi:MAG TPA: dihydroorotase [Bacteroidia bacterium]|nr:dihydroorotase [Bacteroidia bacterium]
MSDPVIIRNSTIVNEGKIFSSDILLKDGLIIKIGENISTKKNYREINADGLHLLPGVIDDQVHFREPGLTQKGDIYTESKAAVAGGITSYMEMPNTIPNTLTQELLEEKYRIASQKSLANYSFYMGASNTNLDEVLKTNSKNVCGIKVFMGSSTGDMLVDDEKTIENIFSKSPMLIATHCEDETIIRKNLEEYRAKFGDDIPVAFHPVIRNEDACFKSSSLAVSLAKKYRTRLHVLHISTARELELFDAEIPLKEKKITAEACIHHLWFCNEDYKRLGNFIKWNPAIKTKHDRDALLEGILNNKIDVIATDHAPHTIGEKKQAYTKTPSGGPLVQHILVAMLEFYHKKKISLEKIVEKMSHAVAVCFQIEKRGFIREGYHADLVLVDLNKTWRVRKSNIIAKCGWSPFEGVAFNTTVTHTFVNGNLVYESGKFFEDKKGQRLTFDRK